MSSRSAAAAQISAEAGMTPQRADEQLNHTLLMQALGMG